jgi:NTP pyrophosphatase (non-canonical NTP hydrolase)
MERPHITDHDVQESLQLLHLSIQRRLKEKGRGAFASPHEALGVITEEYQELIEAVQSDDPEQVIFKLMDVAVAAIFAHTCMTRK